MIREDYEQIVLSTQRGLTDQYRYGALLKEN
jgi:hypothetical protein